MNRLPRRRGGKANKAGRSGELVCVLVARDRTGQTLDWVTEGGQMSKAQLRSVLEPVLAWDVLLVSAGNPTYRYFAQDADISLDAINASAGVHAKGAVHIHNVNAPTVRVQTATAHRLNDKLWGTFVNISKIQRNAIQTQQPRLHADRAHDHRGHHRHLGQHRAAQLSGIHPQEPPG